MSICPSLTRPNTDHVARFVLYQLSKNLNRPFFMDFLTKLSLDYDKEALEEEETEAPLLGGAVLVPVCYNVTQYNITIYDIL